jgi:hypothetical protein
VLSDPFCKIEIEKLANTQTYVINALVLLFVVFVLVKSCDDTLSQRRSALSLHSSSAVGVPGLLRGRVAVVVLRWSAHREERQDGPCVESASPTRR